MCPMYRVWEVGSHWSLWTCDPRYRVWEGGFTLDTVDM